MLLGYPVATFTSRTKVTFDDFTFCVLYRFMKPLSVQFNFIEHFHPRSVNFEKIDYSILIKALDWEGFNGMRNNNNELVLDVAKIKLKVKLRKMKREWKKDTLRWDGIQRNLEKMQRRTEQAEELDGQSRKLFPKR